MEVGGAEDVAVAGAGIDDSVAVEEESRGEGGHGAGSAAVGVAGLFAAGVAIGADAEEFEFVVDVVEAGGFLEFAFEGVDWAGHIDFGDSAALGADEVVVVAVGEDEDEVGGAVVEAEASDDAVGFQLHEEPVDGGGVAVFGESWGLAEVCDGGGFVADGHFLDEEVEGAGAPEPAVPEPVGDVTGEGIEVRVGEHPCGDERGGASVEFWRDDIDEFFDGVGGVFVGDEDSVFGFDDDEVFDAEEGDAFTGGIEDDVSGGIDLGEGSVGCVEAFVSGEVFTDGDP